MANIISISLPATMTKAVDRLAKGTAQTRSEFIRTALREYIVDQSEEQARFAKAFKATRSQKLYSHAEVKKMLSSRS